MINQWVLVKVHSRIIINLGVWALVPSEKGNKPVVQTKNTKIIGVTSVQSPSARAKAKNIPTAMIQIKEENSGDMLNRKLVAVASHNRNMENRNLLKKFGMSLMSSSNSMIKQM
jgi:hypothetical protein